MKDKEGPSITISENIHSHSSVLTSTDFSHLWLLTDHIITEMKNIKWQKNAGISHFLWPGVKSLKLNM